MRIVVIFAFTAVCLNVLASDGSSTVGDGREGKPDKIQGFRGEDTCVDKSTECHNWALRGMCERKKLKQLCPNSCNSCPPTTEDVCSENDTWMIKNCHKSCDSTGSSTVGDGREGKPDKIQGFRGGDSCVDKKTRCVNWARRGWCSKIIKERIWINKIRCPLSCNSCPPTIEELCSEMNTWMIENCPKSCVGDSTDIVMQRRVRGGEERFFVQKYEKYQSGFNSSEGEVWLGLDELHRITNSASYSLVVTLTDWDDQNYTAVYDTFKVGAADGGYILELSGFDENKSTLNDSITGRDNLNGEKFSTWDRDQDSQQYWHCSLKYRGEGGWWYSACGDSNPNGLNHDSQKYGRDQITWYFGGERGNSDDSFASSEFLLRPNP